MAPIHALLIGIDHYFANDFCSSLQGAVADAEAMADYLLKAEVPRSQIWLLTSRSTPKPASQEAPSNTAESFPAEPVPTYEVMVEAIQRITTEAQAGDQVLIHFSGHGGRTPTLIPGAKGEHGKDEGWVPPNIGDPQARYLRDVELAYLIQSMLDKKLAVTLILDACHSGSMSRDAAGFRPRGPRKVDPTPRPMSSLVATDEELERAWKKFSRSAYLVPRGHSASQWLPPRSDYVLLAACSAVECAYEAEVEDQRARGLLTYSLLNVLAAEGTIFNWRQIYDRLLPRVRRYSSSQTPVLEGDSERTIFGGRIPSVLRSIPILEISEGRRGAGLAAGQSTGLGKGALLRILPEGSSTGDIPASATSDAERSDLDIEVERSGATEAWATTQCRGPLPAEVEVGSRAVLIDPGESFRRKVRFLPTKTHRSRALESPPTPPTPDRVARFFDPVRDQGAADFEVMLNARGEYEIHHGDGDLLPDAPTIAAFEEGASDRVWDLLDRLACFYNARDLENQDQSSCLRSALSLELGQLPADFQLGDPVEPEPFPPGQVPDVEIDSWICLSIQNNTQQPLHLYILDLQPGWSIEQVHPLNGLETLEGGNSLLLPLQIYLPSHLRGDRNILKVFGTAEPTDFRRLSLPPLDQPFRLARAGLGLPEGPLERLFAQIGQTGPQARHVRTHHASRHWTSAQVELRILRRDLSSS